MSNFESLDVWKRSYAFSLEVYKFFQACKDFDFKNQIQRAALSILNNIAEGYERGSLKDKQRFFIIAKGSAGEVRSMLLFGRDLGYIDELHFNKRQNEITEISKMIYSFSKNIKF